MNRKKEYYCFARANAMQDHNFTDDVALCKATSKRQAIKIFSRLYSDIKDDEVFIVKKEFNDYGIAILTDY